METSLKKDDEDSFGMNEKQMDELLSGYTLLVPGIDRQERDSGVWTYEIRKYDGDVYMKYRRGVFEVMDAPTAVQEIGSVNADLKEIKEREDWLAQNKHCTNAELLLYLEKCWREIDALALFEKEKKLLNVDT